MSLDLSEPVSRRLKRRAFGELMKKRHSFIDNVICFLPTIGDSFTEVVNLSTVSLRVWNSTLLNLTSSFKILWQPTTKQQSPMYFPQYLGFLLQRLNFWTSLSITPLEISPIVMFLGCWLETLNNNGISSGNWTVVC